MKIKKIKAKNYRLLQDFSIDLEDDLSLVVGKNNCGKTSLLSILDKFLNHGAFSFNDFNIDFKKELESKISGVTEKATYSPLGIMLKIFIEYTSEDDYSNIGKLMMDLDPDNKIIVLSFEYTLAFESLEKLKKDIAEFNNGRKKEVTSCEYLNENHQDYFEVIEKTIAYSNLEEKEDDSNFIDLKKEGISLDSVISYQYIKADRDVSNKEPDKSLSSLSSQIYKNLESNDCQKEAIVKFKDALCDTDVELGNIYCDIFKDVLGRVKKFGGIKENETIVKITSTLQHKNLLDGNTTVVYEHDSQNLPENYNGLGYMNLISMIFEIEIKINKFKRKENEKPADINLLFIEEPEAHTHPQMQYIFINNIKEILNSGIVRDDGQKRGLQCIISTHSSHVVSESNYNDVKYLRRYGNFVVAKNLKDLEKEYITDGEEKNFKFLKQYLTLHRAELFFADKAIFIEGDTERILIPAMMKKIDQEDSDNPLLSQNISIVETGAYSHIFEKFIDFIGVKSLIITDIDSAMTVEKMKELKKAESNDDLKKKIKQKVKTLDTNATITTNESLKLFYGSDKLEDFKDKSVDVMVLKKDDSAKKWIKDKDGYLLCVYQNNETNSDSVDYWARSFEDSFFHLNRKFIENKKSNFKSLKNIKYFSDLSKDAYDLAKYCVDKKSQLAIEILLNSEEGGDGKKFTNWETPDYIKQGLLWLKKD